MGTWKSLAACLGCSDCEMVGAEEAGQKAGSEHWTSGEKTLVSLGVCLEESHRLQPQKEGSKRTGCSSRIISSKFENGPLWQAGNQAKAAGGLHGWTRSSSLNSVTKRKLTGGGSRSTRSRRNTELFFKCVGMELRKPKPTWFWIQLGTWSATRKDSTSVLTAEGRLVKMRTHCWVGQGPWWQRTWKMLSLP